jgi:hypothetical protein
MPDRRSLMASGPIGRNGAGGTTELCGMKRWTAASFEHPLDFVVSLDRRACGPVNQPCQDDPPAMRSVIPGLLARREGRQPMALAYRAVD